MKFYSIRYGSSVSTATAVNEQRVERVLLSLYIHWTRGEGTIVVVLYFHFMTLHSIDAKVNFPGESTFSQGFLTFSTNQRRESKFTQGFFYFHYYYSISSLSQCPTGHESRHFRCQCRVKFFSTGPTSRDWAREGRGLKMLINGFHIPIYVNKTWYTFQKKSDR